MIILVTLTGRPDYPRSITLGYSGNQSPVRCPRRTINGIKSREGEPRLPIYVSNQLNCPMVRIQSARHLTRPKMHTAHDATMGLRVRLCFPRARIGKHS